MRHDHENESRGRMPSRVPRRATSRRLLKNRSDRRWERQAAGSKAARRRHSGRATSRRANAEGGGLPPQPEGRQGVAALDRRWSPLPMRCGIAFKAPPRPGPQDPDAAAAPVLQQPFRPGQV